ncbi:Hypothetical predicted protein [Paramuricea clavata]|uniref:Uncharacterized protein n=1 Tax=Paramuricea clavata TaxID=317549 RepID=A0A6S7FCK5_PARCT|nr:Hypothetical predicted protein [Paramuricea clavata]
MAKKHFFGLFAESGKILSGHNCAKEFDEQTIGKVRNINDKLTEIEVKLSGELEKCTDIFRQSQPPNRKNKKEEEGNNEVVEEDENDKDDDVDYFSDENYYADDSCDVSSDDE